MFTKKNVLISSIIISGLGYFVTYAFDFCYSAYAGGPDIICFQDIGSILFFSAIPVLVICLLVYLMRDEIFHSWFSFAKWWVPIAIIIAGLFPVAHGVFFDIDKKTISFLLSGIFVIISILIIIWKSIAAHRATKVKN